MNEPTVKILQLKLSKREFEVLSTMAEEGLNIREVARKLNLSPNTVSTHIFRLCVKIQARHAYDAIRLYWRWREPGEREFQSWMVTTGKGKA